MPPTPQEALRALSTALVLLFPPAPALCPSDADPCELRGRLQESADALSGLGWEQEIEWDREEEDRDTLLYEIDGAAVGLMWRTQQVLLGRVHQNELLLSLPHRATLRRALQYLIRHGLSSATHNLQFYLTSEPEPEPDDLTVTALLQSLQLSLELCFPSPPSQPSTPATSPSNTSPIPPALPAPRPPHTFVTLLFRSSQSFPQILLASLLLGWCQSFPPAEFSSIRRKTLEILGDIGPAEAMSHLGIVLGLITRSQSRAREDREDGDGGPWPQYVKRTAQVLMGKQVVRNGGVMGLMRNVFAGLEGSTEVLDMHKLEHLAKVVGKVAAGMSPEEYFSLINPQLLRIIRPPPDSTALPDQYIHAACFVLCKILERSDQSGKDIVLSITSTFLPLPPTTASPTPILLIKPSTITTTLSLLLPLLIHAPPSSTILQLLLTSILAPLVALISALEKDKTADRVVLGELRGLVRVWGRVVGEQEGLEGLGALVDSDRGWGSGDEEGRKMYWGMVMQEDGESGLGIYFGSPPTSLPAELRLQRERTHSDVTLVSSSPQSDSKQPKPLDPSIDLTAEAEASEALDALSELELHPSPALVVELVKSFERPSLATRFFVEILGRYQASVELDSAPHRSLYYLQLILLMTQEMSDGLLDQPGEILSFIEHALRKSQSKTSSERASGSPYDSDDEEDGAADSDDEDGDEEGAVDAQVAVDEDDVSGMGLKETAISLLMAILSSQSDLSPEKYPILLLIEKHLKRLRTSRQLSVKQSARQSLTLLSARRAGDGYFGSKSSDQTSATIAKYQEALKLLQDTLLPVRAHGLILLQEVVKAPDFEKALVPGIMEVFLSAIQDDDSYMYLNAVKGLSSMVDGLGAQVMKSLVWAYTEDVLETRDMEGDELDRRLRLGEALMQSVRRSGQAFGAYADIVVPPLIRIFPAPSLPTVLRASSLSILSACAQASHLALLPWAQELVSACLDLLQIESVPVANHTAVSEEEPTKAFDSKHQVLRRAALTFLGELFVALFEQKEDEAEMLSKRIEAVSLTASVDTGVTQSNVIDTRTLRRAETILGYVKDTDVDSLVRFQASEGLRLLEDLLQVVS